MDTSSFPRYLGSPGRVIHATAGRLIKESQGAERRENGEEEGERREGKGEKRERERRKEDGEGGGDPEL